MDLQQKIESEMKSALKSGEALRLSVLRMLVSAVKMVEIEKNLKKVDDADVLKIVQKQVKQHKESIEQFNKGGRADLTEKESAELKILEAYLPAQLSEAELIRIVTEAVKESGALTKSEVGKVMKLAMAKAQGQADGKTINQIALTMLK